jgi:hypothetical protein
VVRHIFQGIFFRAYFSGIFWHLARCGYTLRVTSQASITNLMGLIYLIKQSNTHYISESSSSGSEFWTSLVPSAGQTTVRIDESWEARVCMRVFLTLMVLAVLKITEDRSPRSTWF